MSPLPSYTFFSSIHQQSVSRPNLNRLFFCLIRHGICLTLWLIVFLICIPVQGFSQNDLDIPQLSIQTQSYFHNPETGTYLYRNAKVEWEGIIVESTEINYHPESHKLTASGYVRVTEGEIVAVMDELEINVKDGTGIFRDTIVYDASNKAYMTAKEVRRLGENNYVAEICTFTTCNPKSPAWQITGGKVNYYTQNFSSSHATTLRIGGVTAFYFPFISWPTVKRRQSGFLPPEYLIIRSSVRKWDLGYRFGIPYFWAIDPEQDLTLTYDWVERRGPGLRMDYQYALTEGMRGGIKYQQFFERDPRDPENESGSLSANEIESTDLRPKRFKFEFNHNLQLDDQSRLIFSALAYSDSQFQKEYELVENPSLTAQNLSASINRQFLKGSVTLSATQIRKFGELALLNRRIASQTQYSPVFTFQFSDIFWRSGETTLSRGISGSIIRWYEFQGSNGEEVSVTPELSLVFPVFRHFDASLGINERYSRSRSRDPNVPGSEKEVEYQIMHGNAQIGTTLSRIFSRESGFYSRLKHLIGTTLKYDYIEDVEGSGEATRRLTTLRLNNTLLAKRRYFERSVKLTSLSLDRMRRNHVDAVIIRKLELIQGQEFGSEKLFMEQLDKLFGETFSAQQKDSILAYTEKGVAPLLSSQARGQTREGKTWTLASLNFVQHYDFLKKDPYFRPIGEAIKGNETESGQPSCSRTGCPLLPLRTSLTFNPGPGFSISYFNRYHHQIRQVVEYSAGMSFNASAHNKASVNFRKNEFAYQTPYGNDVAAANTFGFGNSFEASDELAFGFSGNVNLDANSTAFRRRLTSTVFTLDYRPDCWNIRLALTENVGKTTTSSGREKEYIDRTLYAYINLGGVAIKEQAYTYLE